MSADRFEQTPDANDSGSWNKYSYAGDDPVNYYDPGGESRCSADGPCGDSSDGPGGIGWPVLPPCTEDQGVHADCSGSPRGGPGRNDNAVSIYETDARKIAGLKKFKKNCNSDFTALGTTGAANVDIENGAGSTVLQSSLYANTAGYAAAVAQFGDETIGQYIASHPGTVAQAQLNGNAIYVNPALVSGNYYQNLTVTLHEILHNVTGMADDAIQAALGLSTTAVSDNITQRLIKDCF